MVTFEAAADLASVHGDAFYVFDRVRFAENFTQFVQAFRDEYPDSHIAYSYKTNYTPALCRIVDELGGYAEIVSAMEHDLTKRLGIDPSKIVYNGPHKTIESVREVLAGGGVVNIDSLRDVEILEKLGSWRKPAGGGRVALRCNFDIGTGQVSRFGLDIDGAEMNETLRRLEALPAVRLVGLHCHFQDRDLQLFERRTRALLATADRLFPEAPPEILNVGGGYFGKLSTALLDRFPGAPSYGDYGRLIAKLIAEHYPASGPRPMLLTEPGTALVADTFTFFTRVTVTKQVRDKSFVFVAGSMFNTSPYSRLQRAPDDVLSAELRDEHRLRDVVGYTCIEKDVLSVDAELAVQVGDFLVYDNVGSYSIGMKPPFILPNVPVLMATGEGGFDLIKRAETPDDIFRTFTWT